MSLNDIFNVSVSSSSRTPTRQGFGVALVLAYHTRWGVSADRVRSYSSLSAMVSDGFRTSDPAYQMASAAFAQNPAPTSIKVGRRATAFTQTIDITPSVPAIGDVATLKVDGLTVTFTAAAATVANVATGLTAAFAALADADAIIATGGASTAGVQTISGTSLNGVVGGAVMSPPRMLSFTFSSHADWDATTITVTGTDVDGNTITDTFAVPNGGAATVNGTKHFRRVTSVSIPAQSGTGGTFTMGTRAPVTATDNTTKVTCVSVAGQLHSYELVTSNLALSDQTADPGIATELAACLAADGDWYGLAIDSNSEAEINAAAAWVESNGKLFVCQSADAACYDGSSTTDIFADLEAAAYGRTTAWFYPAIGLSTGWLAAGILGSRMPATPGSDTWAFKTIAGVTAYVLTDTQTAALEAKTANWYQTLAGVAVTYNGKVAAGEWVDVVRFLDKRRAAQRERLFALNLAGQKNPFTDRGVSAVRAELAADIKEGQRDGGFDDAATPVITVPKVADVSTGNRQARHLPGVTWSMRLAGAIHSMEVTGTATV